MTYPDLRSLCAELVDELHAYKIANSQHDNSLLVRARAALAESAAGPSDEALEAMFGETLLRLPGNSLNKAAVEYARAVLDRFGSIPPSDAGYEAGTMWTGHGVKPSPEVTGSQATLSTWTY